MAKKTAEVTIEAQVEEILDRAKTDVLALLGDRAEPAAPDTDADEDEKPAKKGKKVEAEAEEPAEETAELPALETIQEMSKEELSELAGKLNIEVEGRKTSETRALLETVHHVVSENTDELDEEKVNALAEAVSIEPAKKLAATIEKLQEYFEKDSDGDGSEGEDEKPAKKGEDEDADKEAPAHPKCVLKAKLPDEDTMKEHLEAHNEAQEDDDAKIAGDLDDTDELETAYRNLLALMVDDDGALAEWGAVYVKGEAAACCGLPCEDTEIKGDDREFAKCLVTGKMFFQNDGGDLEEFVPKKKLGKK